MIKLEQAVTMGFSSEEEFEQWRERCHQTYAAHREELRRDYTGKCVAIDGERIVEFANHRELHVKYDPSRGPQVTVTWIAPPNIEPLVLSGGVLPDVSSPDEEE